MSERMGDRTSDGATRGRRDEAGDARGGRRGGRGRTARARGTGGDAPRSALPTSALAGGVRRGPGRPGESDEGEAEPQAPARIRMIEEHGRKAGRFTVRLEAAPEPHPEPHLVPHPELHPERGMRGGERVSLRSATVSAEIVERLGLREGLVLAAPQVAVLREAAAALRTFDRALNMLAARARSSTELRRKLVEKGEPPALADQAIARLAALGLLDDDEYARQVARGRLLGGASKRRVQQELWRRGVARDVADEAVAEVVADEEVDEEDSAVRVARRKAASLAKLDGPTRRRRLYGFLARRGYDHAAIRAAMAQVLDSSEVDALDDEEPGEE